MYKVIRVKTCDVVNGDELGTAFVRADLVVSVGQSYDYGYGRFTYIGLITNNSFHTKESPESIVERLGMAAL